MTSAVAPPWRRCALPTLDPQGRDLLARVRTGLQSAPLWTISSIVSFWIAAATGVATAGTVILRMLEPELTCRGEQGAFAAMAVKED